MQKKFFKYVSPEVDVVILTQVDIITFSSGTNSGADGNKHWSSREAKGQQNQKKKKMIWVV